LIVLFISKISVADPIKLFFFSNEEFFRVFVGKLVRLLHIEKTIIDAKMTKLNTKKVDPEKKFYRIGYRSKHSRFELLLHF